MSVSTIVGLTQLPEYSWSQENFCESPGEIRPGLVARHISLPDTRKLDVFGF